MSAAHQINTIDNLKAHNELKPNQRELAGKSRRFAAFLTDALITTGVTVLMKSIFFSLTKDKSQAATLEQLFIGVFYWFLPTYAFGQTLGKKLLNIRVVSDDGSPELGLGQTLLREMVGRLLSFILLGGYLAILFQKDRKGWHDQLAKTSVVRD